MKSKTCKCGKEIAANAIGCPSCGATFTSNGTKLVMVLGGIVVLIIILAVIVESCRG